MYTLWDGLIGYLSFMLITLQAKADEWIRIKQLRYLPQSKKVAVFMSEEFIEIKSFSLIDILTGKTVHTFSSPKASGRAKDTNLCHCAKLLKCNK